LDSEIREIIDHLSDNALIEELNRRKYLQLQEKIPSPCPPDMICRAWDHQNEYYIRVYQIDHWNDTISGLADIEDQPYATQKIDQVNLEYFSTLTDRNNNKIFAGDICHMFHFQAHQIIFQEGAFGYIPDKYTGFIPLIGNHNFEWKNGKSEKIEVLGNINQNKDLLTTTRISREFSSPPKQNPYR
jgi:uncharacterized phage protein (TIGR01671 family)